MDRVKFTPFAVSDLQLTKQNSDLIVAALALLILFIILKRRKDEEEESVG